MPKTPVSNVGPIINNNKDLGISVPDSQTYNSDTKSSKKFTVYKVLVKTPEKSYFIFRRYNEFHTLYDKLKKIYPELHLKLPGKKLFGNNFDPDFIKMRREGLNEFVSKILSIQNLSTNPDLREFLQLDNPRNTSNDLDEEDNQQDLSVETLTSDMEKVDLGQSESTKAKPADFLFLKVIGKGSFGKVLLAKHKAEEKFYAIKVLHKAAIRKRNEARHIMAERNVLLQNVKHPFLVGLHYSFQTNDKLYFVLDYVNGGELFFHLQRERYFPEHRARFYAAEIGSAIGYLHQLSIIYRDLKPENILLDSQGHVVLTDFGLCKEGIEPKGTTSTFCGTPEYLAPEVLRKQAYDKSVDWWCLGAVTYEMMYGLPPFYSRDTAEMYDNILHKPLRLRTNVSQSARHLLEQLLQKDRTKRLGNSNADFDEIKSHPFFRTINFVDLYNKKIDPPYNPNVSGQMDLKHFDPEFVREPVPASVSKVGSQMVSASVDDPDDAFLGFTYVPPAENLQE
ncbi:serine/threonine-protein kinase Sgk1 isoform X1 [Hydra vulgaris]|nr:serine/threonine-protein kinase Sgk1 [Hydra vulgaris]